MEDIMKEIIRQTLEEARVELEQFIANPETALSIEQAAVLCAEAMKAGNKILSCGNGGSLCDATHFAEELTGRYRNSRIPLPAISINDPAYMTCVGNDFSFDEIFSRYVEGVGKKGDVLLAITTSGNSGNIVKAVEQARQIGMKIIVLTSVGADRIKQLSDVAVCAPKAAHSDRIQEIHIKVIHLLIQLIETQMNFS
ncbi:sedoheptulose 7-phosphate isomerase [Bacteroidales bacterium KA00344]|nr:sedoheptulose 7-phosphate isomerase [Bacteroidales bacterium KA00344]